MNKVAVVVVLLLVLFFGYYIYHTVDVHRSCDGQVVKNWIDWPVCVE